MAEQVLKYESPRQFVRVPAGMLTGVSNIDGWEAKESTVSAGNSVSDDSIKLYRITLEHLVAKTDEQNQLYWAAHRLADEIATAWCVLCGWPFKDCGMGGPCDADPIGWSSNYNQVSIALQKQESSFIFEAAATWSYRCVTFPFMPLATVMDLRKN